MKYALAIFVLAFAVIAGPYHAVAMGPHMHENSMPGMSSACGSTSCDAAGTTADSAGAACVAHCMSAAKDTGMPVRAASAALLLWGIAALLCARVGDLAQDARRSGQSNALQKLFLHQRLATVVLRN